MDCICLASRIKRTLSDAYCKRMGFRLPAFFRGESFSMFNPFALQTTFTCIMPGLVFTCYLALATAALLYSAAPTFLLCTNLFGFFVCPDVAGGLVEEEYSPRTGVRIPLMSLFEVLGVGNCC